MKIAESQLSTKYGLFTEHLFFDGKEQAIALSVGDIEEKEDVLVRVHSHCISSHIFNSTECDCREQMQFAQELIAKKGFGIIIWLDQEGKGNGHLAKMLTTKLKQEGYSQEEAYKLCGYHSDAREYNFAAKILEYFKVRSVQLICNHTRKIDKIQKLGINITAIINTPIINE